MRQTTCKSRLERIWKHSLQPHSCYTPSSWTLLPCSARGLLQAPPLKIYALHQFKHYTLQHTMSICRYTTHSALLTFSQNLPLLPTYPSPDPLTLNCHHGLYYVTCAIQFLRSISLSVYRTNCYYIPCTNLKRSTLKACYTSGRFLIKVLHFIVHFLLLFLALGFFKFE